MSASLSLHTVCKNMIRYILNLPFMKPSVFRPLQWSVINSTMHYPFNRKLNVDATVSDGYF